LEREFEKKEKHVNESERGKKEWRTLGEASGKKKKSASSS